MEASNFIFKKYSPDNKRKFINEMNEGELLRVDYATILRCIKEAGEGDSRKVRCKFKHLNLRNRGAKNHWNSEIESIFNSKKDEVYLNVYIQGDDIDINVDYKLRDFLNNRYEDICVGHLEESFSNGYSHRVAANYDRSDRADVIKAILLAYIDNKYKV